MSKRRYKLYLEPGSTIEVPPVRSKRRQSDALVCTDGSTDQANVASHSQESSFELWRGESTSGSGSSSSTEVALVCTDGSTDQANIASHSQEALVCTEGSTDQANIASHSQELTSSIESLSEASSPQDDPFTDSDQSNSEDAAVLLLSSFETLSEATVFQDDSEDIAIEDDPFGQIGLESDMNSVLESAGTTTKAEALLMIMSHAARHNITGTQLDDLLTLINNLFGKEVLPRLKYLFNKVFKNHSDIVKFHYYCKSCKLYLGMQKDIQDVTACTNCACPIEISSLNSTSFFINVPIAPQIQVLLETPEIEKNFNYRCQRTQNEQNVISDIFDGEMYRNLSKPGEILSHLNNLSFNFNSDGSPVFKSSKFSIWPIQLHLNELPPKFRFKNVVFAGLWFGAQEPVMSVFLKPFVSQSQTLATKGVSWRNNGKYQNSKIIGLCCCVDSKARPAMQNTTQFNGYFGCGFCLHPGTLVEKQVKYTVTATEFPERDTNAMLADMELAMNQNKSIKGVKGPSPLMNMPYFDIVWGFVPDYMHAVLLGVIRQVTDLHLHITDQPYYIGNPNTMQVLEKRMSEIKPPHLITRLPRPLGECKHWKASEWRAWLLFYCLPVLNGVLQPRYVKHLSLLVTGVFLLLKEKITFQDINRADEMLFEFVSRFQLLYGEASMTFNVHLLTHLVKSVKLWGPLWAHSAFVFEDANGGLLKLVHGTKSVALQIVNKFLLYKAIPLFTTRYTVSMRVKDFCVEQANYQKVKSITKYQSSTVLDNGKVTKTTDEEKSAFISGQKLAPEEVVVHKRMVHKGLVYTSIRYSLSKRRKDCYAMINGGVYAEIQKIVSFPSDGITEIAVLLKKLPTQMFIPGFVSHIRCVQSFSSPVYLVSVEDLLQKCLVLKICDETYICDFPNVHERD